MRLFEMLVFIIRIIWILSNIRLMFNCLTHVLEENTCVEKQENTCVEKQENTFSQIYKNTFFTEHLRWLLLEGVFEGTTISDKIFGTK